MATTFATRPTVASWPVYQPRVAHRAIYFPHPGARPRLRYNHDVDIVRFQGRYVAAWNANEIQAEDVPGQFNFLSVSDDFATWTVPVRPFCADGGCTNPVETDNQWQPSFINWRDETLFCNWCDYNSRRTFIATSPDGTTWTNREVPTAPPSLDGQVVGFPTNHGLLTRSGAMLFPCSLPAVEDKCIVGHTRYAGILISEDGGRTWSWSEPIEAVSWSELGEDPAPHGGEIIYLWEPMVYAQADGTLGLLIRNSTSQDNPERPDQPHQMLLYGTSADGGHTWTRLRPVEVDTIISRCWAAAGVGAPDGLVMVHNDWHVNIPKRISHDRYYLSLFVAPIADPDLLLPGPVVQPDGGTAFYPNGFVEGERLRLGYTYPPGAHSSTLEPLPDFSRPFLLPRGGRPGLTLTDDEALLGQRQSTLGLVLTPELTRQACLRLAFDACANHYDGNPFPLLTLGGKTRNGALLRVRFDEAAGQDALELVCGEKTAALGAVRLGQRFHVEVILDVDGFAARLDRGEPLRCATPLLRKIAFGGLYLPPAWPQGLLRSGDVRVRLDTLVVE